MASYRPKSLDELNNLYGKAVSAEKAIKKGTSLLGEDALSAAPTTEKGEDVPAAFRVSAEQKVESVSPDIDAFIRQFSSDDGRPVPLSKLTPPPAQETAGQQTKDEGITGLMDDYENVMKGAYDDEDEDEPKKNLFKQRRGKKKASKEIVADSFEPQGQQESVRTEVPPVSPAPSEVPYHAGASLFENDDAAYNDAPVYRSPQGEIPDGADDEAGDEPYDRESEDRHEDFEFGDIGEAPHLSAGKKAAKFFMILLLVLILVATAATGACVLTVNSDKEIGGYRICTVDSSDVKSGVTEDDLIFCKKSETYQKDENVVYYDASGKRAAGKIILANGNDTYNINISDVQQDRIVGSVQKSVSSFGKIAKIVSDSFLMVLIALVAIAIVITLILCFAFKPKAVAAKAPAYNETDDSDRQLSEQSEDGQDGQNDDELFSGIE